MEPYLIVLCFSAIAAMRVIQKLCVKRVSGTVVGAEFFHYGGYYNLISTLLSFISVCMVGFTGFTLATLLCAAGTAFFLAIELFSSLMALKSCSLIICQMFSVGSLCIPCIVGIFLFDEPMSIWQWLGILLFMVAMYFMIRPDNSKKASVTQGKLSLKTILLLVVLLVAGGGTMVMQKAFGILIPDGNVTTYSFLMFACNSLFMYVVYAIMVMKRHITSGEHRQESAGSVRLPKLLLVCGAFLAFAVFVINFLVTTMGRSVPSALLFSVSNAISIAMTLIVGALYYKERISFFNTVGILLCVASIAIINFL